MEYRYRVTEGSKVLEGKCKTDEMDLTEMHNTDKTEREDKNNKIISTLIISWISNHKLC